MLQLRKAIPSRWVPGGGLVRAQPKSNPQPDAEAAGSWSLSPGTKHIFATALRCTAVGEKGNKVVRETILALGHRYSIAKVSLKTRVPEEGHIWLLFVPKFQFSWLVPWLCAIH